MAKNTITVDVPASIKAAFTEEGKRLMKLKDLEYNQGLNAYVTLNVLKAQGVDFSKAKIEQVLAVLQRAGNASANRQAIENEGGEKTAKAVELANDLLA